MRSTLGRAVGTSPAPNRLVDQRVALALLSLIPPGLGGPSVPIFETPRNGVIGPQLQAAIYNFQRRYNPSRFQDGRIDPGGRTLRHLNELVNSRIWQKSDLAIRSGEGSTIILPPVLPSINIGQSDELFTQPSEMACWATVVTKMRSWLSGTIDLDFYEMKTLDQKIQYTLSYLKRSQYYTNLYKRDYGLPQSDNNDLFVKELNGKEIAIYKIVPPEIPLTNMFFRVISTKFGWHSILSLGSKPKLVATARMINGKISPHLIMLTGFEDINTPNKFIHNESYLDMGGTVIYENTNPGESGKLSISDLDYLLSYVPDNSFRLNNRSRCWVYM